MWVGKKWDILRSTYLVSVPRASDAKPPIELLNIYNGSLCEWSSRVITPIVNGIVSSTNADDGDLRRFCFVF